jgi:ATP phosphoribosyltransferase regulatory subunit
MKRYDLITPEGTRDLLFEGCLARRMVEDRLSKLFEGFGYSEVVTPGIEFYDLFMGSSRNFQQESLYKLTDSKGRLIVMRPDSTIPIARLASTRLKGAKLPLRLYYNQSIFENNSLLKGRSDEVVQAGIELIGGENSKRADYEVLCTAVEALSSFDKENFRLEIGHIGYFKELVAQLDVDDAVREEIRLLISAKNYPALNDILDEVGDNQVTNALRQLPRLFGYRLINCTTRSSFTFLRSKLRRISWFSVSKYFDKSKDTAYVYPCSAYSFTFCIASFALLPGR